jgi:hypothetical protein
MGHVIVEERIKISGQGITFYNHYHGLSHNDNPRIPNPYRKHDEKNSYASHPEILSRKSISGIKNSIYALLWLSDCNTFIDDYVVTHTYKKISFITLTLPAKQSHPDVWIKKHILNQFLVELRRDKTNFLYVWRSEKQKQGNIHIHLLINNYYDKFTLQKQWNRLLDKANYIEEFSNKFSSMSFDDYCSYMQTYYKSPISKCLQSFNNGKATKWRNPPSTHIQSLHSVGNISAYISKEMTKENQCLKDGTQFNWDYPLSGKNWSCSEKLTEKSSYSGEISTRIQQDLTNLQKIYSDKVFKNDFITHYSLSPHMYKQLKLNDLNNFYQSFLKS